MSFKLRPYQASDFETLYVIDHKCYPRGIAYSRDTLRWFLLHRGSESLIAENDPPGEHEQAQIIGFIIGETERQDGHVITLDVAPEQRRGGVGSALLRALERRLAGRGAQRMHLETATNNEVAIAFWQRHGYRAVGVIERYYLNRIDALSMAKPLEPLEPAQKE